MSGPAPMPPGWYYAAGDAPGTERYWDGASWQAASRPKPPMAAPSAYRSYPEASQATTAIVLSALSIAVCGILGPFGWHYANQELEGINAGRRDPSNRGMAQAAKVIGIVATVLLAISLIFIVFVLFLGLGAASFGY